MKNKTRKTQRPQRIHSALRVKKKWLNLHCEACIEFMDGSETPERVNRPEWSGQAVDAEESQCSRRGMN